MQPSLPCSSRTLLSWQTHSVSNSRHSHYPSPKPWQLLLHLLNLVIFSGCSMWPFVTGFFHLTLKKLLFCWRILDLQYGLGFCHTAKWFSYTYTFSFLSSFSIKSYCRVLVIVPFSQHVFRAPLCCGMIQHFILFYG